MYCISRCQHIFVYWVHVLCSVKPVAEKAPLVIPLIQHNRWLTARKPEDLEADDDDCHEKTAVKVADIKQTGDKETDAALREILSGKSSIFSAQSPVHICVIFRNSVFVLFSLQ